MKNPVPDAFFWLSFPYVVTVTTAFRCLSIHLGAFFSAATQNTWQQIVINRTILLISFSCYQNIRRKCKYLYRIAEQIRELIYYDYICGNTKKPQDYETKNMYAYV